MCFAPKLYILMILLCGEFVLTHEKQKIMCGAKVDYNIRRITYKINVYTHMRGFTFPKLLIIKCGKGFRARARWCKSYRKHTPSHIRNVKHALHMTSLLYYTCAMCLEEIIKIKRTLLDIYFFLEMHMWYGWV